MSSSPGVSANFSQVLPTQENLSELLEKLLTVFGIESILEAKQLPGQPLQRETGDVRRHAFRPMVGNDFHVQTSFGLSPSWTAWIQFDQDAWTKLCLPFCDVALQPKSQENATVSVQQMAKLLRAAWPDANVDGPSKYRQLGPPFVDTDLPDYRLFRWLASKDLNPVYEGVCLTHLNSYKGWLYQPLRQKTVRSSSCGVSDP